MTFRAEKDNVRNLQDQKKLHFWMQLLSNLIIVQFHPCFSVIFLLVSFNKFSCSRMSLSYSKKESEDTEIYIFNK